MQFCSLKNLLKSLAFLMVILSLLVSSCKKNSKNDKDDDITTEIPGDMKVLVNPPAEAMVQLSPKL